MPRRTEPKGAHAALRAYCLEVETDYARSCESRMVALARVEVARKALNLYEEALEQEAVKKRGPANVRSLSNVG
jgi:hypothetical protein